MAIEKGHHFPVNFGYSGSAGKQAVKGYSRSAPAPAKSVKSSGKDAGSVPAAVKAMPRKSQ